MALNGWGVGAGGVVHLCHVPVPGFAAQLAPCGLPCQEALGCQLVMHAQSLVQLVGDVDASPLTGADLLCLFGRVRLQDAQVLLCLAELCSCDALLFGGVGCAAERLLGLADACAQLCQLALGV